MFSINSFFKTLPVTQTIWVAYSGGLDSHVLLHLIKHADLPHTVRAVHVNHGLNPAATSWALHCQAICDELEIPLTQLEIDARAPKGKSLEEYAREKRYAALIAILKPGDVLATAHHQDDQAETFLVQLLRGAGLPGLASMAHKKKLGAAYLVRPLLDFPRDTLLHYANEQKLNWIEDDSNAQVNFNRNYLRHRVMPTLKARWPAATKVLSRGASHCANAQALLEEVARDDLVAGSQEHTLSVSALLQLSILRQANVIRYWLHQQNFLLPSEKQLHEIIKTLLYSRHDANPVVTLPQCELRRFRDEIYVFPKSVLLPDEGDQKASSNKFPELMQPILWDGQQTIVLPNIGKLISCSDPTQATHQIFLSYARYEKNFQFSIRLRQGGEKFHPQGRVGTHPLKKLMQEWQIPPWQRATVPLLYVNNDLVCVIGYAIAAHCMPQHNETGISYGFIFEPEKR